MKIFELRTYTLHVGKLSSAIKIYEDLGWPALKKNKDNIIRYYVGDVGALNQIIHLWQFQEVLCDLQIIHLYQSVLIKVLIYLKKTYQITIFQKITMILLMKLV